MRTSGRNAVRAAACACLAFTTACTTMTQGTSQELFLQAQDEAKNPVTAIPCKVYTKAKQWELIAPGKVTVDRSGRQLFIICENEQWVMAQTTKVDADTSLGTSLQKNMGLGAAIGAAFALLVIAPALMIGGATAAAAGALGGAADGAIFGTGTDLATGAFWEYAPEITVTVKPRSAPVPAAASATPLPAARSASAAANDPSQ